MQGSLGKLTRGAIMLALAVVLSMFAVFSLPNGGSATIGSMVPVIIFAIAYGAKWGCLMSVAYGLLQMVMGFYPPPTQTFFDFLIVILFDYIIAFGCLGLAGIFFKKVKNITVRMLCSASIVIVMRFVCHFISGILIWRVYAPEGQSPAIYSLLYNGSFMGVELIVSLAILSVIAKPVFEMLKHPTQAE